MTPLGWLGRKTSTQTNRSACSFTRYWRMCHQRTKIQNDAVWVHWMVWIRVHIPRLFWHGPNDTMSAQKIVKHMLKNVFWHSPYYPNPLYTEMTLPHYMYILEESNFNFRYIQLLDLHIPREKWLIYLRTLETLIRHCILRHLIWVCTVCQLPFYGSPNYNGLMTPCWCRGFEFSQLTLSMLWAYLADDTLIFFPENKLWHFMQIFSSCPWWNSLNLTN